MSMRAVTPPAVVIPHTLLRAQHHRWSSDDVRRTTLRHGRYWTAFGLATVVAVVTFAVLRRSAVEGLIVDSLGSRLAIWLILAVGLQAGSMSAFAQLQQRVLASAGLRLPLSSSLAITYAGNAMSVTIPFVGSTASVGFTYRQYVRRGASPAMASWAVIVAGVISTIALAMLVGVGGLANGNPLAIVAGVASVAVAVLPVLALLTALRSGRARRFLERTVRRMLTFTKRIVGRPRRDPASLVRESARQLSTYRLHGRDAAVAAALACLNWLLDALCLWTVLQAFNVGLPARDLAVVYAAAVAAAAIGFTPAGIGTVAAAIALALTNFASAGAHALPAALAYRAISTWIVLLVGWVTLAVLRRTDVDTVDKTVPEPDQPWTATEAAA